MCWTAPGTESDTHISANTAENETRDETLKRENECLTRNEPKRAAIIFCEVFVKRDALFLLIWPFLTDYNTIIMNSSLK